ncbi:MAG: hypothetical protein AB7F22_23755 [Reyranella sp.]|uniref:hypothetical protein n=1 Tax=Reyranella sp. TaxID=1929291 RepID=UPI003D14914C
MRWLVWLVIAALVATTSGCAGEDALYTNPKYTPGYKPAGDKPAGDTAHAYDRALRPDWRQL